MKCRFSKACFVLPLLVGGALSHAFVAHADGSLPVQEVVHRAVARAQQMEANSGRQAFTYTKATVTEEFDSSGNVKERKEKVYQVFFQDGSTRLKLLQVNGQPPKPSDLKQLAENDANARKVTGDAKSKKRPGENVLTPELVSRFEFSLVGREFINGRDAYQISFQPKTPEPPTHGILDRLLNQISGTLWIDAQEFELARASVQLKSEVNLLGGALACLKKLAFTVTRTRVADGIWLSTSSNGDFQGRKLIQEMRIKVKSSSTNFRQLG